jgi:hypothetical protein
VAVSGAAIVSPDGLPVVYAPDQAAWRVWLEANAQQERGAWLVFYKKGFDTPSVNYEQAVDEAVAYGWIDSRSNRVDDARYIQLFTPRKPGSVWSRTNQERVGRLIAAGRMAPAGLAAVEEAKRRGRWDALSTLTSPSSQTIWRALAEKETTCTDSRHSRLRARHPRVDRERDGQGGPSSTGIGDRSPRRAETHAPTLPMVGCSAAGRLARVRWLHPAAGSGSV